MIKMFFILFAFIEILFFILNVNFKIDMYKMETVVYSIFIYFSTSFLIFNKYHEPFYQDYEKEEKDGDYWAGRFFMVLGSLAIAMVTVLVFSMLETYFLAINLEKIKLIILSSTIIALVFSILKIENKKEK